jgi:hypothetical protein
MAKRPSLPLTQIAAEDVDEQEPGNEFKLMIEHNIKEEKKNKLVSQISLGA